MVSETTGRIEYKLNACSSILFTLTFFKVLNDGGRDGFEGEQGSEVGRGGGEQGGASRGHQEHVRSGRQGGQRPTRFLQSWLNVGLAGRIE